VQKWANAKRIKVVEIIFFFSGPMIERIVVLCQTRTESLRWVEILRQQIKCARTTSSLQQHHHPLPPPHKSVPLPASPLASAQSPKPKEKPPQLWKMSCLRPAPPTRPTVIQPDPGSKRNSMTVKTNANKKEPETSYEEEMQILRVIEAYCNLSNAKTQRHTFSATSKYHCLFVVQIDDFLPKKNNQPMKCLSLFPSL